MQLFWKNNYQILAAYYSRKETSITDVRLGSKYASAYA